MNVHIHKNKVAMVLLPLLSLVTLSFPAAAFELFRSENSDVKSGNEKMKAGDNGQALAEYDEAAKSLPSRAEVHLNRGLAASRMGEKQIDTAMQALVIARDSDADTKIRARAAFNLGNAFFSRNDYQEAIKNYKKSLMLVSGNRDAAWNLELALKKQKEKEEQEKKDQEKKDQEKKDQEKQDEQKQDEQKQDEQKQDEQKQDEQKQDEQKQDEQKQDEQKQEQGKPEPQKPPSAKEQEQQEAVKMLDALDQQDNDFTKNKARMRAVGSQRGVKDW